MTATDAVLDQVINLLDSIDHAARARLGHEQRLGLVTKVCSAASRLEALRGVIVAEADAAGSSLAVKGTPTTTWLGMNSPVSPKEAAGLVFTGRDLAAHPETRDAALSGQIGVRQARSISGVLDQLPEDLDDQQRAAAEQILVDRARTTPAEKLSTMGQSVLDAVSPNHPENDPERQLAKLDAQRNRARLRRSLTFSSDGDGSTIIRGSLPTLDAAGFVKLIEAYRESDRRRGRDQADRLAETRTPEQRRADALLMLVAEHQRARRAPSVAGDRPRLVVTIREQDLRDRAEMAGLIEHDQQITAGELRRLCCDADLLPAVLGAESEVLDIGRTQRLVTPAIRRALSIRDGGCVFPGCDAPDVRCDAHHIYPWYMGGKTSLDNLVLLCPHHHQLVEPCRFWTGPPPDRWEIRLDRNGLPEVIPPKRVDPERKPIPCRRGASTPASRAPQPPSSSARADQPASSTARAANPASSAERAPQPASLVRASQPKSSANDPDDFGELTAVAG